MPSVQKRVLGVFTLAMINVAAIISLRNLSIMVDYGLGSIFFYTVASLLFFIPSALVCAELATGWPLRGGLFAWVSVAFGQRWGLFAIWISWILSISWFPAVLTFSAAAIAYLIDPALSNNKLYMVSMMLVIFWSATLVNFFGIQTSSWISSVGAIIGTVIPGILIISLGLFWLLSGRPLQLDMSWGALMPSLELNNVVFFVGVLLGLAGMEMSAYHARETKNPQRDYPKAIATSGVLILCLSVLGSLGIAFVVPKQDVHLVAGLLQAFQAFFAEFGIDHIVPWVALLAAVGSLAGINTWIMGPAKGILAAADEGLLPEIMHYTNRYNVPVVTLLVQAILGSLLALVFFFMPDVNSAYWIITAITVQFAMIMYCFIFAAAIRLRYCQPDVVRAYKIPGKNYGMWIVSGLGFLTCLFGFCVGFIPPKQLTTGSIIFYDGYLFIGLLLLSVPPFIFYKIRKG
ncbi:MAG: amino acid permease [Gammaproteobacteria bacterium]